ncbi:MAG: P-loop NTPase [Desulfosarcinaceae bacterium]|nr:P-loop NTPase [Desulfosarcinaceae bacterium]
MMTTAQVETVPASMTTLATAPATDRGAAGGEGESSQAHIIAIGGAKGGIGKSLLAANLGVYLAANGNRTVLVDLDLGGANLHLFLGIWSLERKIDDFLEKRFAHLEELLLPTKYGPLLIGGGGGALGAANIHHARKLKLLRALRKLRADVIIIDLGGDTSFNMLDFYLAAQTGVVMTTMDPASYLDAYNFIKVGLMRRLNRIFGPESPYRLQKDERLASLVRDFVAEVGSGRRVASLVDRVAAEHPQGLQLLQRVISAYRPRTVINMPTGENDVAALAERLRKVSARMLSIEVDYLGELAYDDLIHQSTQKLVPHVARHPEGSLARFCERMVAGITPVTAAIDSPLALSA